MSTHYKGCAFNDLPYMGNCRLEDPPQLRCVNCNSYVFSLTAGQNRPDGCTCPIRWVQSWHIGACKLRGK